MEKKKIFSRLKILVKLLSAYIGGVIWLWIKSGELSFNLGLEDCLVVLCVFTTLEITEVKDRLIEMGGSKKVGGNG